MYRGNSLKKLACKKEGTPQWDINASTSRHESSFIIEEIIIWRQTKDNLVAYYTYFKIETDKTQLNRNIQSSSVSH